MPRRNGWSCPCCYQIVSWLCVLLSSAAFYGLLIPGVKELTFQVLFFAYSVTLGSVVLCGVITTTIDPSDLAVKNKLNPQKFPMNNDIREFSKMCGRCHILVKPLSKHCRVCDRCTEEFDHHCVWVNNCIGASNYRWFFFLILALEAFSALQIALGTHFLIVVCWGLENIWTQVRAMQEEGVSECGYLWLVAMALIVLLSVCVFISNTYLIVFHIRLKMKGMTTHQHILYRRRLAETVVPDISKSHDSMIAVRQVSSALSEGQVLPNGRVGVLGAHYGLQGAEGMDPSEVSVDDK